MVATRIRILNKTREACELLFLPSENTASCLPPSPWIAWPLPDTSRLRVSMTASDA